MIRTRSDVFGARLGPFGARESSAVQPNPRLLSSSEKETDRQAYRVRLRVWRLPRVVLMLVVRRNLCVLANRKETTGIQVSRTPLPVLTGVVGFDAHIGNQMIGMDRKGSLEG